MRVGALLIDDSRIDREEATAILRRRGIEPQTADSVKSARQLFDPLRHQIVIVDLYLGESTKDDGFTLAKELRERSQAAKQFLYVIMITGTARTSLNDAYEHDVDDFVKKGELDYRDQLACRVKAAIRIFEQFEELKNAKRKNNELRGVIDLYDEHGNCQCIDESGKLRPILATLPDFARSNITILITGATGTGKELFARAFQQLSHRCDKPFLTYNCAQLTEHLAASDLFGHERGAFTGAERQRDGCFHHCNGGTLFLDEVAELPMQVQAMLLRALQEEKVRRVGGTEEEKVDVRVIAATNRNLDELIAQGKFREDLKFRLEGVHIRLPSLKDRRADIVKLAEQHLANLSSETGRSVTLSKAAQDDLLDYPWPGNVRELRAVLQRALVLAHEGVIHPQHLMLGNVDVVQLHESTSSRIIDVDALRRQLTDDLHKLVTETEVPLAELNAHFEARTICAVHGLKKTNFEKAKILRLKESQYDRKLSKSRSLRDQFTKAEKG